MSEQQESYNKTTTYTELLKLISSFARQKMMANWEKPDPMTETIKQRAFGISCEYMEFDEAIDEWIANPTNQNLNAALYEAGDLIDEIIFTCGKMIGYTEMKRE